MLPMTRPARRRLALLALVCAGVLGAVACTPARSTPPAGDRWPQRTAPRSVALPPLAQFAPPATAWRAAAPPAAPLDPALRALAGLPAPAGPPLDFVAPNYGLPAGALPPAALPVARIPGDGPWMPGARIAQTERLDLYLGKQSFAPEQVAALAPQIEQALRDGEARFGERLERRVSLAFYRYAFGDGARGLAFTDERRAELYFFPFDDPARAVTVAAHELGHMLEAQRYGDDAQRRADTILLEGMATWIAADRWLPMCGAASWRERARQLQRAGIPLRLLTAERAGTNQAYEMWASFVDFLAERYGWEKLDALYRSGRGRAPGSSDYRGVLGKSLDDVADEWRAWAGG